MSHLHWMPLYIGDELAETSHLTAEEFGAYISLKMHYWQHGGLPADDNRLARIARAGADRWAFVKDAIQSLFEEDWRLDRLEQQRATAEETHMKRSEAGRKGGRPRRDEKPGNKPSFSEEKAGPKQPQPEPQPYSKPNSQSQPDEDWALEEEELASTREVPYPIPASIEAGRALLVRKGISHYRMNDALRRLMAGCLFPCDIESWQSEERGAA
ncbi:hypothetical protein CU102_12345 [Phyllobacterium brassicacearum]|uniref:DUF1376 domain-containing protein n=1 Tax=Phyllobacterium brassicacearum TaxID=314235 RepID=A0A2P7BPY8_9HYPH|nr:DUF1376 domain-containing protein [Phyllobacterium brassicacearum]PSH68547.1 hypothetical protein CU102_12345 [Phyllobacterium brassicacearum]TDQ19896.1 uncharacterized protein YdaU (DUF1376 family) [Phyllobacterium brassicacearum]